MICTALSQSVYAADTISFDDEDTDISESFEPTDDSIEFDDVQLISTEINNGVMRSYYTVNWTISANKTKQGNTKLNLKNGDFIYFDLEIAPKPTGNIYIGAYNSTEDKYHHTSTENSSYNKFYTISVDGDYYIRIKNNTSENITVTGMYEAVNYIGSTSLSIPLYKQEDTKWCWAACIQMCAKYKGYTATQTNIVKAAKGKVVNEGASSSDDYANGMEFATSNKYTATQSSTLLSPSKMKEIMNKKMPIIISIAYYSDGVKTGTHANVVIAVDKDNKYIRINDPNYNGASKKNFKYSVITSTDSSKRYSATVQFSQK